MFKAGHTRKMDEEERKQTNKQCHMNHFVMASSLYDAYYNSCASETKL